MVKPSEVEGDIFVFVITCTKTNTTLMERAHFSVRNIYVQQQQEFQVTDVFEYSTLCFPCGDDRFTVDQYILNNTLSSFSLYQSQSLLPCVVTDLNEKPL